MPKPDGSVIIDTKFNTDGLKSQFAGLGSAVKKIGGLIAAAFSVKAIVDFSKEAIELGSNLQEVQNVVDVTFTTMNQQVNEFSKNAAKSAGLSETMAKKYVGTFGAMSKSFGFAEEDAYQMSTSLAQLTGDVASFYNLSQDAAYTKLKSVFTGETESLKDLGVVMTQTALDDFALRNGLGKTTQQMSEQEKVALRYQFVMQQLSGASGDFVRTQDSWANQTRVLNLQFEQLKATIGQGLINVLTPLLKIINQLIERVQVLADKFLEFTNAVFGNAGGASSGMAESAESAGMLADSLEQAEKNAKKAKKELAGFDELNILSSKRDDEVELPLGLGSGSPGTVPVGGTIQDNISPQIQAVVQKALSSIKDFGSNVKKAFEPTISAWGDAFSSLVPSVKETAFRIGEAISNLWDTSLAPFGQKLITEWVPDIVNTFSETFAPIFADIMPVAMDIYATDFENTCRNIEEYCDWLEVAFEDVKMVFSDMCLSISTNWQKYGGALLQGFKDFKNGLWEIWWNIYNNIINPVLTNCSQMFDWLWTEHLKPLWDGIVEFAMSVSENILALWNGYIKPVVDYLVAYLAPIVTNVINGIWDGISRGIAFVSDAVTGLLKYLDGLIQFIVGVFTLDWERAWGGIKKIFEGVWAMFEGVVKGVVNSIIGVINQLIGAIYSGVAGVVNGLGSIVETVGDLLGMDWGFSIPTAAPKIPYLAQGAVLPPNKPFMAMVGDQRHGTNVEAPLATIQEAVANVMNENISAMMAGFEALLEENRTLREIVERIEVGDTTIGQAANRYNQKMAIIKGGL